MNMNGKKLKPSEIIKIRNRFNDKVTEFREKSFEDLKGLLDNKMSSIDRKALIMCYQIKQREQIKPNNNGSDAE
jgi:hypothetical protein